MNVGDRVMNRATWDTGTVEDVPSAYGHYLILWEADERGYAYRTWATADQVAPIPDRRGATAP